MFKVGDKVFISETSIHFRRISNQARTKGYQFTCTGGQIAIATVIPDKTSCGPSFPYVHVQFSNGLRAHYHTDCLRIPTLKDYLRILNAV